MPTLEAVDVLVQGGQHKDWNGSIRAQPPADAETVLAGKHCIEHDEIELLARKQAIHVSAFDAEIALKPLLVMSSTSMPAISCRPRR